MAQTQQSSTRVEGMAWSQFLPWFQKRWQPGEHVALVGPTGRGKTTTLVQIAATRPKVVFLDIKGGDSTLRRSGFETTKDWPPLKAGRMRSGADWWHGREGPPPKAMRYVYSPPLKTMEDYDGFSYLFGNVLRDVFTQRGWTVGIDEAKIASTIMGLDSEMLKLLIAARDRSTSVLAAFQRPAGVLREALDQVSYVFAWPVRDRDTQARVSEVLGEDRRSVEEILGSLSYHDVLVLDVPDDKLIITRPAKV